MSRRAHAVWSFVLSVVAAFAVAWVVAVDLVTAAAWRNPFIWALAMGPVAIRTLFSLTHAYTAKSSVRWVSCGALLLGVLVVLVPWNERKWFVHDLFSGRAGMSMDAVATTRTGEWWSS